MEKETKILIAEDDANLTLALKVLLKRGVPGAAITSARDGQEALELLELLEQSDYQLLISDWNMPRLTGLELLTQVRANPRTQQLPFLMLTGRADLEEARSRLSNDATSMIGKPFESDALITEVLKLLAARRQPNQQTLP